MGILGDNRRALLCGGATRRTFVCAMLGAPVACAQQPGSVHNSGISLRIEQARIEVAPGRIITTATYNGSAPGPLIRMQEGVPVAVNIFNHTDALEYVHWHGFEISPELD